MMRIFLFISAGLIRACLYWILASIYILPNYTFFKPHPVKTRRQKENSCIRSKKTGGELE
jgi:hypothetical protein